MPQSSCSKGAGPTYALKSDAKDLQESQVGGTKVILEVATKFPTNALVHLPKKNLHHDFIGTKKGF